MTYESPIEGIKQIDMITLSELEVELADSLEYGRPADYLYVRSKIRKQKAIMKRRYGK